MAHVAFLKVIWKWNKMQTTLHPAFIGEHDKVGKLIFNLKIAVSRHQNDMVSMQTTCGMFFMHTLRSLYFMTNINTIIVVLQNKEIFAK